MTRSSIALGAGATSVSAVAETVQISQNGNTLSGSIGVLNPDLTGDGRSDLPGFSSIGTFGLITSNKPTYTYANFAIAAFSGGPIAFAGFSFITKNSAIVGTSYAVSIRGYYSTGSFPKSGQSFVPIIFSDARINGGAVTGAWLEVRAASLAPNNNSISFLRTVFDDASPNAPIAGIVAGGTNKEWLSPTARASLIGKISKLKRKVKKLKGKAKKAKRGGNSNKGRKLSKKSRKTKKQQKKLSAQL